MKVAQTETRKTVANLWPAAALTTIAVFSWALACDPVGAADTARGEPARQQSAEGAAAPNVAGPCSNGLYIVPGWFKEARPATARAALIAHLRDAHIRDAFVYANSIGDADTGRTKAFLQELKSALPDLNVTAMLGRKVCTSSTSSGCFDLAKAESRESLAKAASRYWALGFDGVQADCEPVKSGDTNFLDALDRLRAVKPQGKFVSVAGYSLDLPTDLAAELKPSPKSKELLLSWSKDYYSKVLERVDQVMVMNYDTALWTVDAYTKFTIWQTRELLKIRPSTTEMQLGLPSDVPLRKGLWDKNVENLHVGIAAVLEALGPRHCPPDFGVTIFTESGMTAQAWKEFTTAFGAPAKASAP